MCLRRRLLLCLFVMSRPTGRTVCGPYCFWHHLSVCSLLPQLLFRHLMNGAVGESLSRHHRLTRLHCQNWDPDWLTSLLKRRLVKLLFVSSLADSFGMPVLCLLAFVFTVTFRLWSKSKFISNEKSALMGYIVCSWNCNLRFELCTTHL